MAAAADPLALLRIVSLCTGAMLHIAPLPTMREIINSRSTLNFHIAPYASTLLNHLINGYYAVIRQDGALMIHRAAGIIANSYYVYTYLSYCPPARYADSRRFLMRVAIILLCMLSELHMLLPLFGLQRYFYGHLAVFAALTGIGLAASPLATVREVITQRDSSSLPLGLCATVTIQCTSWAVYGYLKEDWSTFANNAVGVVLGSVQLGLIFMCPNKRRAGTPAKLKSATDVNALEQGTPSKPGLAGIVSNGPADIGTGALGNELSSASAQLSAPIAPTAATVSGTGHSALHSPMGSALAPAVGGVGLPGTTRRGSGGESGLGSGLSAGVASGAAAAASVSTGIGGGSGGGLTARSGSQERGTIMATSTSVTPTTLAGVHHREAHTKAP